MGSKCTHLILLAHWSAQREARDLLTSGSTCEHGLRRQHSSQAAPRHAHGFAKQSTAAHHIGTQVGHYGRTLKAPRFISKHVTAPVSSPTHTFCCSPSTVTLGTAQLLLAPTRRAYLSLLAHRQQLQRAPMADGTHRHHLLRLQCDLHGDNLSTRTWQIRSPHHKIQCSIRVSTYPPHRRRTDGRHSAME